MKTINEFEYIKNDIFLIRKVAYTLLRGLIDNILVKIDNETHCIGHNIGILKLNNYIDQTNEIGEEEKYTISLFDGSFICACYSFNGVEVSSFSLSFLPNIESEELSLKALDKYNGEYYLRIDFEPHGYIENTHPKIHLHTDMNKKCIRLPIDRIVSVSEFLYFVLKNIYGIKKDKLDVFYSIVSKNKCRDIIEKCFLTENELSSFCVFNGIK